MDSLLIVNSLLIVIVISPRGQFVIYITISNIQDVIDSHKRNSIDAVCNSLI
jgi:hypothetical protein